MQINIYKKVFQEYFNSPKYLEEHARSLKLIEKVRRIFFVGNGGSNSICSHMMEDFAKIGRFKTFAFSDPALITCYANDYGYENALAEWIKLNGESNDLLIAISSSGSSKNIINAVKEARQKSMKVITLSGFLESNKLIKTGDINFYIESQSYGVVECFHQVILHTLLDDYSEINK
tara:strand:- start:7338 stop:7865 length:528 start_codon:yes stop_codon:yes gene_type:complete